MRSKVNLRINLIDNLLMKNKINIVKIFKILLMKRKRNLHKKNKNLLMKKKINIDETLLLKNKNV